MTDDGGVRSAKESRLARALALSRPTDQPVEAKVSRLRAPGVDVDAAAAALARWFESEGLEAQVLSGADGVTVQARSRGKLMRAVGAAVALTVTLRVDRADLLVEVGPAKWGVKGAIGGIAIVTTTPFLAVPAAWGTYNQLRLPKRAVQFLTATLPSYTRSRPEPTAPVPAPPTPAPAAPPAVDPNSAGLAELAAVAGPKVADEIIRRRHNDGPYRSRRDFATRLSDQLPPADMARILPALILAATTPDAPPPNPPPAPVFPPADQGRAFG
jgi:hypothetical protein